MAGDARIRTNRSLWWASGTRWPSPLWLMLEGWHWLCWVGYSAWLASWRMDRAQRRKNVPKNWPPGSGCRVLRLALAWCFPPRESVRFGLHRRPDAALDYVFDQELGGWHRLRSLPLGLSWASMALLQDKPRLSDALGAAGISMAPILAVVARETPPRPLSSYLSNATPVFCKMRLGNQGRGAFATWRVGDGWAGRTFSGQPLADTPAVEQAWQALLQLDDALIQPRLDNHPALAELGLAGEAITVRYISDMAGRRSCLSLRCSGGSHSSGGKVRGDRLHHSAGRGRHGTPAALAIAGTASRRGAGTGRAALPHRTGSGPDPTALLGRTDPPYAAGPCRLSRHPRHRLGLGHHPDRPGAAGRQQRLGRDHAAIDSWRFFA